MIIVIYRDSRASNVIQDRLYAYRNDMWKGVDKNHQISIVVGFNNDTVLLYHDVKPDEAGRIYDEQIERLKEWDKTTPIKEGEYGLI